VRAGENQEKAKVRKVSPIRRAGGGLRRGAAETAECLGACRGAAVAARCGTLRLERGGRRREGSGLKEDVLCARVRCQVNNEEYYRLLGVSKNASADDIKCALASDSAHHSTLATDQRGRARLFPPQTGPP
jgi:hypothetical protein